MKSLFPFFEREFVGDQLLEGQEPFRDKAYGLLPGGPTAGEAEVETDGFKDPSIIRNRNFRFP